MHIGGSLLSAVLRIAVIAATLALVYHFLVRPVLDTTEKVSGGIQGNIQKSLDSVNDAFRQTGEAGREARIKRQIRGVSGADQQRLLRCVQRAGQDVIRIQRCANRFAP